METELTDAHRAQRSAELQAIFAAVTPTGVRSVTDDICLPLLELGQDKDVPPPPHASFTVTPNNYLTGLMMNEIGQLATICPEAQSVSLAFNRIAYFLLEQATLASLDPVEPTREIFRYESSASILLACATMALPQTAEGMTTLASANHLLGTLARLEEQTDFDHLNALAQIFKATTVRLITGDRLVRYSGIEKAGENSALQKELSFNPSCYQPLITAAQQLLENSSQCWSSSSFLPRAA